jgi:hypothetical protein
MRRLDYKLIPQNTPEFVHLIEFAKSFDHDVIPHPNINYFGIYREGKLIAYSSHVYMPVVYPAFHPEYTNPRDVIQVLQDFKSHLQISNTQGFIGTPAKVDRLAFTDEIMKKLGFDLETKREIFTI